MQIQWTVIRKFHRNRYVFDCCSPINDMFRINRNQMIKHRQRNKKWKQKYEYLSEFYSLFKLNIIQNKITYCMMIEFIFSILHTSRDWYGWMQHMTWVCSLHCFFFLPLPTFCAFILRSTESTGSVSDN